MSSGDAITIVNDSGSNISVIPGTGLTVYNAADGATGTRTLASRGMCTTWFSTTTTAYISGAGLS